MAVPTVPTFASGSRLHRGSRATLAPTPTSGPSLTPAPIPLPTASLSSAPAAAATPTPSATASAHGLTPGLFAKSKDRAYDLVSGKWTCRTFAGTPIEHVYRRTKEFGSLDVDTILAVDGQKVRLHEVYRLRKSSGLWSVSLDSGQFIATAAPWIGDTWTFSGIVTEKGRAFDSSMTYKRLSADEFVRTFDRTDGGITKAYSGEHCLRITF